MSPYSNSESLRSTVTLTLSAPPRSTLPTTNSLAAASEAARASSSVLNSDFPSLENAVKPSVAPMNAGRMSTEMVSDT